MIHDFHDGMHRSRLGVIRAVDQPLNSGVNQRSCTHRARFNCSKQLAVSQAVVADLRCGLAQRHNFSVCRRVGVAQVAIPPCPQNLALAHHNRAHRHFTGFKRPLGGPQRLLHQEFVRSCLVFCPWIAGDGVDAHCNIIVSGLSSSYGWMMVCFRVMGMADIVRKVFLIDLIKGLSVTFRYQNPKEIYTEQYPLQRPQVAERYRGAPRLNVNPDTNETMCIACDLCALACPEHLIVVSSARNEQTRRKELTNFTYDLSRCMFCGLCEDACPVDALELTQDFELASYTREGAIWNREMLETGPQPTQYRK